MYPLPELRKLWETEALTNEQLLGQLLLYVEAHEERLMAQQRRLDNLGQPAPSTAVAQSKRVVKVVG